MGGDGPHPYARWSPEGCCPPPWGCLMPLPCSPPSFSVNGPEAPSTVRHRERGRFVKVPISLSHPSSNSPSPQLHSRCIFQGPEEGHRRPSSCSLPGTEWRPAVGIRHVLSPHPTRVHQVPGMCLWREITKEPIDVPLMMFAPGT
ncbi:hypothetical protein KIL84_021438 [Mauremys mutica]|uniref:Uncharacterized protein n=1 Tax=Mauremys mutica TaxID=74926 RepID=A0A9D3X6X2_9SAUR|nr:hypothetical protein KIL84_021438 [Mauremys mutica]